MLRGWAWEGRGSRVPDPQSNRRACHATQVMLAVCSAPIQFLSPEWRGVSRDARDLVTRMLDRNPATRLTAEQALEHHWFAR